MDAAQLTKIVGSHQVETVRVSYEDMANPRRVGTVVEHCAGEFRVMWDDDEGGEAWSDLRQAGWKVANPCRKLWRVSIFRMLPDSDEAQGLAVWERFGDDREDVAAVALRAAENEWPEYRGQLEAWVNSQVSAAVL